MGLIPSWPNLGWLFSLLSMASEICSWESSLEKWTILNLVNLANLDSKRSCHDQRSIKNFLNNNFSINAFCLKLRLSCSRTMLMYSADVRCSLSSFYKWLRTVRTYFCEFYFRSESNVSYHCLQRS